MKEIFFRFESNGSLFSVLKFNICGLAKIIEAHHNNLPDSIGQAVHQRTSILIMNLY